MSLEQFFTHLWDDYVQIAPLAGRLRALLEGRGETIVNDHIAFRTFDRGPIQLESLEKHILALGYQRYEPYHFADKKLRAFGYVHDRGPRIFLSELETGHFSPSLRYQVEALCAQIDPAQVERPDILWSGRPWSPVSLETYRTLLEESEYAGWVAALGLRANHFTISVNHLKSFADFPAFLDYLEGQGFALNLSGGRIKGSPEVLLEQASTLADRVSVEFAGGQRETVPSCYYEFALRYPDPASGQLYQGFVAASADKIFESTDTRNHTGIPQK